MDNKFIINPFTGDNVDDIQIIPGQGIIDCNYDRVRDELLNSSSNYDSTNKKDIKKSEFVYLPDFPSNIISYEKMVEYGKDKYYWDALNQKLYTFNVTDDVQPFVKQHQVIKGTNGNPSQAINVLVEFSKGDGVFNEINGEEVLIDSYITVHGHPSYYALRPYDESKYYYDDVHDKYYKFISNYTTNIHNFYYDNTLSSTTLLKYLYDAKAWTSVNESSILEGNPNNVIHIIDNESTSTDTSIDDINKEIYYVDNTTETLYLFDYGQYFHEVEYTGTIYERPFEFYRKLADSFLDINSTTRVLTKNITYIWGKPAKVKTPSEDAFYYDARGNKYYKYNDGVWDEITQEALMVPHTLFPYSHGELP